MQAPVLPCFRRNLSVFGACSSWFFRIEIIGCPDSQEVLDREEDDREIAITDSDFAKLRRFFKETGLPTVASYFVLGPAWAVVTFMVSRALKSDDKKTRDKVVRELEEELKLTREKIEDSRSDGNKQAKYALMRLESKLEKQIAEVKYGLR